MGNDDNGRFVVVEVMPNNDSGRVVAVGAGEGRIGDMMLVGECPTQGFYSYSTPISSVNPLGLT